MRRWRGFVRLRARMATTIAGAARRLAGCRRVAQRSWRWLGRYVGGATRVLARHRMALLGAALSIAAATVVAVLVGPFQEVRADQAVQQDQARRQAEADTKGEAVRVKAGRYLSNGAAVLPPSARVQARAIATQGGLPEDVLKLALDSETGVPFTGVTDIHERDGRYTGLAYTSYQITLAGNRSTVQLVTDIRARILSRSDPRENSVVFWVPEEGSTGTINVWFDLGSRDLRARKITYSGTLERDPYLWDQQFTLAKDEQMTLDVLAVPGTELLTWVIDLRLADGSTATLTDNGKPFRSTPTLGSYIESYRMDVDYRWHRCVWPKSCL